MPELPEVEAARRLIDAHGLDRIVARVEVRDERVLEVPAQKVWGNLNGHTLTAAHRHGKNILLRVDNGRWLALHFGMTGDVDIYDDEDAEPDHSRVLLHFEDGGYFAFDNPRLFGEVRVVDDPDDVVGDLGPDALDLDADAFKERVSNRRGMIKTALMDQATIAGIGNVFSDEILFQARLHPRSQLASLSDDHVMTLYDCMRSVLETSTEALVKGAPLPESFMIYDRETCPGCDGSVEQIRISGRNAYFCPACQEEVA